MELSCVSFEFEVAQSIGRDDKIAASARAFTDITAAFDIQCSLALMAAMDCRFGTLARTTGHNR